MTYFKCKCTNCGHTGVIKRELPINYVRRKSKCSQCGASKQVICNRMTNSEIFEYHVEKFELSGRYIKKNCYDKDYDNTEYYNQDYEQKLLAEERYIDECMMNGIGWDKNEDLDSPGIEVLHNYSFVCSTQFLD